jgi:hypothetical protein
MLGSAFSSQSPYRGQDVSGFSLSGPSIRATCISHPETKAVVQSSERSAVGSRDLDVAEVSQKLIHAMVWIIPPSTRRAAPLVAEASFEQT